VLAQDRHPGCCPDRVYWTLAGDRDKVAPTTFLGGVGAGGRGKLTVDDGGFQVRSDTAGSSQRYLLAGDRVDPVEDPLLILGAWYDHPEGEGELPGEEAGGLLLVGLVEVRLCESESDLRRETCLSNLLEDGVEVLDKVGGSVPLGVRDFPVSFLDLLDLLTMFVDVQKPVLRGRDRSV